MAESKDMLALAAYLGLQSRGEKIAPPADQRLRPFLDAGRERFASRQGELNLACNHCHDDNWGKKLAGNAIPGAIRTATRFTASNGRASARCNAGSATA